MKTKGKQLDDKGRQDFHELKDAGELGAVNVVLSIYNRMLLGEQVSFNHIMAKYGVSEESCGRYFRAINDGISEILHYQFKKLDKEQKEFLKSKESQLTLLKEKKYIEKSEFDYSGNQLDPLEKVFRLDFRMKETRIEKSLEEKKLFYDAELTRLEQLIKNKSIKGFTWNRGMDLFFEHLRKMIIENKKSPVLARCKEIWGEVNTLENFLNWRTGKKQDGKFECDAGINYFYEEEKQKILDRASEQPGTGVHEKTKACYIDKSVVELRKQPASQKSNQLTDTQIYCLLKLVRATRAFSQADYQELLIDLGKMASDELKIKQDLAKEGEYIGVPRNLEDILKESELPEAKRNEGIDHLKTLQLHNKNLLMPNVELLRSAMLSNNGGNKKIYFEYIGKGGKIERFERTPRAIVFSDLYYYLFTDKNEHVDGVYDAKLRENGAIELQKFHIDRMFNVTVSDKIDHSVSEKFDLAEFRSSSVLGFTGETIEVDFIFNNYSSYVTDRFLNVLDLDKLNHQKLEYGSNHKPIHHLRVTTNNSYGTKMWFLQQSSQVKIMCKAHSDIRDYIIFEFQKALKQYSKEEIEFAKQGAKRKQLF